MYELARGPLMWVATIVFVGGIAYRTVQLFLLTKKKERARCPDRAVRVEGPEGRRLKALVTLQNSLLGQHPVMAIVTFVFHFCLFVAPVFTLAHILLLRESWRISYFSLPGPVIDVMTVIVILGAIYFLVRRLSLPEVKFVTSASDFVILAIVAGPFVTGFLAYHQWFAYPLMMSLHVLAGDIMLAAIPFTRLSHMLFAPFTRAYMGSEFGKVRHARDW